MSGNRLLKQLKVFKSIALSFPPFLPTTTIADGAWSSAVSLISMLDDRDRTRPLNAAGGDGPVA